MYEGHVITYRPLVDLILYTVGTPEGNELMLASVMNGFADALGLLMRGQVEKRTVLERLDEVVLCLDEAIDEGFVRTEIQRSCAVADFLLFFSVIFSSRNGFTDTFARCPSTACLPDTPRQHSIILESDPTLLASRVTRREPSAGDIPLAEQTLSQALQTARDQLARSLLK